MLSLQGFTQNQEQCKQSIQPTPWNSRILNEIRAFEIGTVLASIKATKGTNMKSKLSKCCEWLLKYLAERDLKGLGIAAINPLPTYAANLPADVKMVHMRGLLRRGWVEERANGIYYLTPEGRQAALEFTDFQDTSKPCDRLGTIDRTPYVL